MEEVVKAATEAVTEKMDVLKVLVEKLKDQGLEIGEEAAKSVIRAVFETSLELIEKSENKYDDLLEKPLEIAFDKLMELAEDINKSDNAAEAVPVEVPAQ